MKLDRNTNPDGRGKYALIQLRDLHELEYANIELQKETEKRPVSIPSTAIHIGNEGPGEQFFVIKYKDQFAAPALHAYAQAVRLAAFSLPPEKADEHESLIEYADEMENEALIAASIQETKLPD